jgi:hypothetical protein
VLGQDKSGYSGSGSEVNRYRGGLHRIGKDPAVVDVGLNDPWTEPPLVLRIPEDGHKGGVALGSRGQSVSSRWGG